ncbi:MAG: hypothetical protein V3T30_06090, partial [Thermodesulfobacteriota bacterium]
MAKLDSFVESLNPDEELILETNKEPGLRSSDMPAMPMMNQVFGTRQISNLLDEIIPGEQRRSFEDNKTTVFTYTVGIKSFEVSIIFNKESLRAIIKRGEDSSGGFSADPDESIGDDFGIIRYPELDKASPPSPPSETTEDTKEDDFGIIKSPEMGGTKTQAEESPAEGDSSYADIDFGGGGKSEAPTEETPAEGEGSLGDFDFGGETKEAPATGAESSLGDMDFGDGADAKEAPTEKPAAPASEETKVAPATGAESSLGDMDFGDGAAAE